MWAFVCARSNKASARHLGPMAYMADDRPRPTATDDDGDEGDDATMATPTDDGDDATTATMTDDDD